MRTPIRYVLIAFAALSLACGGEVVNLGEDGGGGGGGGGDGGGGGGGTDGSTTGDGGGGGGGGCAPDAPQCNNCIDDDSDGFIDGFDPECTSALDNLEDSFATGIPGDNIDAVKQDCFFDGNSGGGDDGCDLHVCCLLDVDGTGDCPPEFKPEQYDPADCTPTQQCIDNCGALTPPGCDCFGCCTVCDDTGCYDILTHPEAAPNCDQDVISDPVLCPPCAKVEECGDACDPANCILCPGQTEDDLPPECVDNQCPGGQTSCNSSADCEANEFCSTGCCIANIP